MMARVDVSGLPARRAVRLRAEAGAAALDALSPHITSARVTFTDVNGDKGGVDVR